MRPVRLSALALCFATLTLPSLAAGTPPITTTLGDGTLTVILEPGPFRMLEGADGVRIDMDGFGQRTEPGKPRLPERRFLMALPPGATVRSIESTLLGASELPGTHRVAPSGAIERLVQPDQLSQAAAVSQAEWAASHDATYDSDDPYPAESVRLTGSGSLRKYAYASVAFSPFQYHPQSGRLIHHEAAEVVIHFDLPEPGSEAAHQVEALARDQVADEKASRLFANFEDIRDLYLPPGSVPLNPTEVYDYVILTNEPLAGVVGPSDFVTWKRMLGHNVRIVLTTDPLITSQPGGDFPERIRNFLRSIYAEWGVEYLLVVGDIYAVPMRYCYPDPANHGHNPSNPSNAGGSVPTDYYYADLSLPDAASWDTDGDRHHGEYGQDNPDFLAEISVGRIPTSIHSRLTYTLDKLVAFEQDMGAWKDCALHPGAILFYENQDHRPGLPKVDGARCPAAVEIDCMPAWALEHWSEQEGIDPSDYPWSPLSMNAFVTEWRTGQYGVVNWSGHGSPAGAYRMIWTSDDGDGVCETNGSDGLQYPPVIEIGAILDDDYPSIIFGVSCNIGYPEPNSVGNLGVDLLTKPGVGAGAGVVTASRIAAITGNWPDDPGGTESICYEFNRFLLAGPSGPERVGDALYDAKFYTHLNYSMESWMEHLNLFDFNLYGDPAMVREGMPVVDVADGGALSPVSPLVVLGNAPNPFALSTHIQYVLPTDSWVRLVVFDVRGNRVATLVDGQQRAGTRGVRWDARNADGQGVGSGIYFYRLEAGASRVDGHMTVLR